MSANNSHCQLNECISCHMQIDPRDALCIDRASGLYIDTHMFVHRAGTNVFLIHEFYRILKMPNEFYFEIQYFDFN